MLFPFPMLLPGLDVILLKDVGGLLMNIPTHSRHTPQMHSVQAYDSLNGQGRLQLAQYICISLFRNVDGVGLENRWCWRGAGGNKFKTGLESEFAAGRILGSLFPGPGPGPGPAGPLSSDDSIDGNGSKSLSRLRS